MCDGVIEVVSAMVLAANGMVFGSVHSRRRLRGRGGLRKGVTGERGLQGQVDRIDWMLQLAGRSGCVLRAATTWPLQTARAVSVAHLVGRCACACGSLQERGLARCNI